MKREFLKKLFVFVVAVAVFVTVNTDGMPVEVGGGVEKEVYLGGWTCGVKINIEGIMIVGISSVLTEEGASLSPAREAGLKTGDVITKINNRNIKTIKDMTDAVLFFDLPLNVTANRGGEEITLLINPVVSKEDGQKKIGAWVRDQTAGIGTVTFIDPDTEIYGALGHSVSDADCGLPLVVGSGSLFCSVVADIKKGERGSPGELCGIFSFEKSVGDVLQNTEFGIFGTATAEAKRGHLIKTALRDEVKKGEAYIVANIEGDEVKNYKIEITKLYKSARDNKGIVIKITDEELIKKTGGIVQGMSGCPIIQNNKLVGAITHVFLNDPTKGYGTFIDQMINNIKKFE